MNSLAEDRARPSEGREAIAAIVVTFNRKKYLKTAISALLATDIDRIYIVDNGSTDGTREYLSQLPPQRVTVLSPPENLGGAGGFELGMKTAFATEVFDWYLLFDDDAHPADGAVATFRAMAKESDAAYASAVYYPDGQPCEMNRPSLNPFWHGKIFLKTFFGGGRMGFHLPDRAYSKGERTEVDVASFVGLFIPHSAIAETGFPDGRFFIYSDDVVYSLAMRFRGIRIWFEPTLIFIHDCRTKDRESQRVERGKWKIFYLYRNGIYSYRRLSGYASPFLLPVFMVKWFLTLRAYAPRKAVERRLYFAAISDGLRGDFSRPHDEVLKLASDATSD